MTDRDTMLANSQTLSNTAIGLLTATGAFLAFALDKRELGFWFWLWTGIGASLLVLSMVLGGKGLSRIDSPGGLFNRQAWTCLLGLTTLVFGITQMGPPTTDETLVAMNTLAKDIGRVEQQLSAAIQANKAQNAELSRKVAELQGDVTRIKGKPDVSSGKK